MSRPVIYVVEFGDGCVKVGRTSHPERLKSRYEGDARRAATTLVRHWVSEPHHNHVTNEAHLIAWCQERGVARTGVNGDRGEYFDGLTFEDVVAHAQTLTLEPVPADTRVPLTVTFDWVNGLVLVTGFDEPLTLEMSHPLWVAHLMLLGGSGSSFATQVALPVLRKLGQVLPPVLRGESSPETLSHVGAGLN